MPQVKKFDEYLVSEGYDVETIVKDKTKTKKNVAHVLVLYDDSVNSIEFVVESLIKICRHSPEQANQVALITHFNGKCEAKEGDFDELMVMKRALNKRGITANVEEV